MTTPPRGRPSHPHRRRRGTVAVAVRVTAGLLAVVAGWLALAVISGSAQAAPLTQAAVQTATVPTPTPTTEPLPTLTPMPTTPVPTEEVDPATGGSPAPVVTPPHGPGGPSGTVNVQLQGLTDKPSTPVVTILALTLLSVAPAILLTCTSFTKILVVLGLTRNALGLQQTPPNQVLAGLALFLSLFVMAPVLGQVNDEGVQPYLSGEKTASAAFESGVEPLRAFMLDNTDDHELKLLTNVAHRDLPKNRDEVSLATLVPAFVLTELKQAFIIGFIVFIPFLVIDLVVSGVLMALGMMMMPPVMVSLPFKLLLFVMVDGWALVIKSLVASYA